MYFSHWVGLLMQSRHILGRVGFMVLLSEMAVSSKQAERAWWLRGGGGAIIEVEDTTLAYWGMEQLCVQEEVYVMSSSRAVYWDCGLAPVLDVIEIACYLECLHIRICNSAVLPPTWGMPGVAGTVRTECSLSDQLAWLLWDGVRCCWSVW